jgi:hypothetical protein
MKTFSNYLFDTLKIMAFFGALAWLVSCDDETRNIRLIQQYNDSIGIAKAQVWCIEHQADSARRAFSEQYPMRAYAHTRAGGADQVAYKDVESQAYHELLKNTGRLESKKWPYYEAAGRYKRIVDSLKLTLK